MTALTWIQTHPYATAAIALLVVFSIICVLIAMDWLRGWLDEREAEEINTDLQAYESCADEGATVHHLPVRGRVS